jgi:hypothetical protein
MPLYWLCYRDNNGIAVASAEVVTANAKPATANNLSILFPPVFPPSCIVEGSPEHGSIPLLC